MVSKGINAIVLTGYLAACAETLVVTFVPLHPTISRAVSTAGRQRSPGALTSRHQSS